VELPVAFRAVKHSARSALRGRHVRRHGRKDRFRRKVSFKLCTRTVYVEAVKVVKAGYECCPSRSSYPLVSLFSVLLFSPNCRRISSVLCPLTTVCRVHSINLLQRHKHIRIVNPNNWDSNYSQETSTPTNTQRTTGHPTSLTTA
jgi:hypothetical protein